MGYILGFLDAIAESGEGSGRLLSAVDGTMKRYFHSEKAYSSVRSWIVSGANQADFLSVQRILEASCNTRHSSRARIADVVTETYDDIKAFVSTERESRSTESGESAIDVAYCMNNPGRLRL